MPLIGPMLLLIFENLWAYALIQDYAFIRTLRVMVALYCNTSFDRLLFFLGVEIAQEYFSISLFSSSVLN